MYSELVYFHQAHYAHIAAYEDHARWERGRKAYLADKRAETILRCDAFLRSVETQR